MLIKKYLINQMIEMIKFKQKQKLKKIIFASILFISLLSSLVFSLLSSVDRILELWFLSKDFDIMQTGLFIVAFKAFILAALIGYVVNCISTFKDSDEQLELPTSLGSYVSEFIKGYNKKNY